MGNEVEEIEVKDISTIIPAIVEHIEDNLPAILAARALTDFAEYQTGYATAQDALSLAVRYAESNESTDETFSFMIHLQLKGQSELNCYGYIDAVREYINSSLDQEVYEYARLDYRVMMFDTFEQGIPQVVFDITLSEPLDDCD
jgi:hypothetical protein